jgi:hypothetical protein
MANDTTIAPELLDQLLANYAKPEDLLGEEGLFKQLKKALIERAPGAELTEHPGYEKGDPAGRGSGNNRNGVSSKTVLTDGGEIEIAVPRDRAGTFEPQLIPKGQTRFEGFDDKILSLYARGMTVREIQGHLTGLYGIDVSPDLISRVTGAVLDEIREWQSRPLGPVYPIVFFDALRVKIRDEGLVRNKAVYAALAFNANGEKEVLGLWIEQTGGAKFWLKVVNELKTRGVNDISDCRGRRAQRFSGGDHDGIPADPGSNVHRASDQEQPGLCQLEGSQGDHAFIESDLPRRSRRHRADEARGIRGGMGEALPPDRPDLAKGLGARRALFRLRPEYSENDLYHKLRRGAEPLAAQDHQDPRELSQ